MADVIDRLITDEMRAHIGETAPAWQMTEEIGASDVRRFLEVIGETNPIYRDDDYARRLGYKGRIVPPMLIVQFSWRMLHAEGLTQRRESEWPGLTLPPGYTNTRNASQEYDWLRPVYVGDRLTLQTRLKDIYVRQGRAGVPVIYLVLETEIRNQHGEIVALQAATLAKMPAKTVSA